TNELGAVVVDVLDGGEQRIAEDVDLDGGPSTAWRLDVASNPTGRVLAYLEVATGSPKAASSEAIVAPGIQGVAADDHVVVFSTAPLGRPAALPFSYRIKAGAKRQHLLFDMTGSCNVDVAREADGFVTVRVSAGSRYRSNEHGIVR